jgi:hypothetical protein
VLEVGIDPSATDGVDSDFGEERAPLAPPAPANVFATLVDDHVGGVDQLPGTGTKIDVRQGQEGFADKKSHEISLEFGPDDINQITFRWDLPAGVTGTLNARGGSEFDMAGSGSATVEDLETPFGTPIPRHLAAVGIGRLACRDWPFPVPDDLRRKPCGREVG